VIVLDTHVGVWLVSDPKHLSARARAAIDQAVAEKAILISSSSAWEVALLVARGRLKLTMEAGDWIARSEDLPFLRFVAGDNAIAVRSVNLPGRLHGD
jgi:PIN domain nuclease of toxin-antitoxin system